MALCLACSKVVEVRQSWSMQCCGRPLCAECEDRNPRLKTYCPLCQDVNNATIAARRLEGEGTNEAEVKKGEIDEPPSYEAAQRLQGIPPSYLDHEPRPPTDRKSDSTKPMTQQHGTGLVHYIQPLDSLNSLSLLYQVSTLKLLDLNRHIPRAVLSTPSLLHAVRPAYIALPDHIKEVRGAGAREPVSDVERAFQIAIRRTQLQTKETVYEVAKFYVDEAARKINDSHKVADEKSGESGNTQLFPQDIDLEGSDMAEWVSLAVRLWAEDSDWERGQSKGKGKGRAQMSFRAGARSIF